MQVESSKPAITGFMKLDNVLENFMSAWGSTNNYAHRLSKKQWASYQVIQGTHALWCELTS